MKVSTMSAEQENSRLSLAAKSPMKRPNPRREQTDLRTKLHRRNKPALNIDQDQVRMVRPSKAPVELESDQKTLDRRSKELQIGKNTASYSFYRENIEKENRERSMPRTPDKYSKMPRRRWDGLVKAWKVQVHRIAEKLGEEVEEDDREGDIKEEEEEDIKEEEGDIKEEEEDVSWREEDAEYSWCDEIDQQESENDELFRSRASSCASSDQGIGMDYSGTGTPRTMSGATSPTTFLVPASKEKQLSTAITKLCDLSKSATS